MTIRIAHLVSSPAVSGVTAIIKLLLLNLEKTEFDQHLIHYGLDEGIVPEMSLKGIPVYRIKQPPLTNIKIRTLWTFAQLHALNYRIKPDLIHAHSFDADLLAIRSASYLKIPTIVSCQSFSYAEWAERHPRHYRKWGYRFKKLIPVCRSLSDRLTNIDGLSFTHKTVIYNCPDLKFFLPVTITEKNNSRKNFGIANGRLVIANVANFSFIKGQDILIKAFLKIFKKFPETILILAGGSNLADGNIIKSKLIEIINQNNMVDHVMIIDPCINPREVFAAADIYIQPSRTEALSVSIGEAMAIGLPVIAMNVGGNPEIVKNNQTGIILPENNEENMANAIEYLLLNPDVRKSFGEQARTFAFQFLFPKVCTSAYRSVYKEALNL